LPCSIVRPFGPCQGGRYCIWLGCIVHLKTDGAALAPAFFALLVGIFLVLFVLIQIRVLRYAYMTLGISSGAALLLLFGSLIG
jgi:hypothetical protein